MSEELVHIRATAHLPAHPRGYLPSLERGGEALVDPDDPWIQTMLGGGWMVPLDEPDAIPRGE